MVLYGCWCTAAALYTEHQLLALYTEHQLLALLVALPAVAVVEVVVVVPIVVPVVVTETVTGKSSSTAESIDEIARTTAPLMPAIGRMWKKLHPYVSGM